MAEPKSDQPGKLGTSIILGAGAAGISLLDAGAGVAAAGAAPLLQTAAELGLAKVLARRRRRASAVLASAARLADLSVDDLTRRLESDEEAEELLLRTLSAAKETASREKLILLAVSLAAGVKREANEELQWETLFVRAIGDLDAPHIDLLKIFAMSRLDLGLGNADDDRANEPVEALNTVQLDIVAGSLENRTALLATLQRHGLVEDYTATGGLSFSIGRGAVTYALTDFGREVHDRLTAVGQLLTL